MRKEEHILYWRKSSIHDLESAESMFTSGRYDWSLFVGHLALEKILKAVFVHKSPDNDMPPKTHNLARLSKLSDIKLDEDQMFFLDKINDFNIQARYPDYKLQFYKRCTTDFTRKHLDKIKEFHKCFDALLK